MNEMIERDVKVEVAFELRLKPLLWKTKTNSEGVFHIGTSDIFTGEYIITEERQTPTLVFFNLACTDERSLTLGVLKEKAQRYYEATVGEHILGLKLMRKAGNES